MASVKTMLGLAQIRVRNGVTLSQIADDTKIGTFFLQAIEDEQFSKLPGGVFDRSYIRQYAAAAGVPETKLLDRYAAWLAEQSDAADRKEPSGRGWFSSLLASVLN
jgi:cytoskeletal protein RodZ